MKRRAVRFEAYEHDPDLCARGCGRGCSRNTHDVGFHDGVNFAMRTAGREITKLNERIADRNVRIRGLAHDFGIGVAIALLSQDDHEAYSTSFEAKRLAEIRASVQRLGNLRRPLSRRTRSKHNG